jgi:hypothetical protein
VVDIFSQGLEVLDLVEVPKL